MISLIRDFINGNIEFIDIMVRVFSIAFVVFCASPLHEYAHALIATKLGDDTPRLEGRLTINPKAHIDPIGAIMIFLFGFGYAKPVSVRMRNFKNPKRDMALVAIAGPVCNLLQALVFMFLQSGFLVLSSKTGNAAMGYIATFFLFAAAININLAVFNLLPIPPLDGSRIATALLPTKYYYKIMQYERYIMLVIFLLLFTGILTKPLSYLSSLILKGMLIISMLPFGGLT